MAAFLLSSQHLDCLFLVTFVTVVVNHLIVHWQLHLTAQWRVQFIDAHCPFNLIAHWRVHFFWHLFCNFWYNLLILACSYYSLSPRNNSLRNIRLWYSFSVGLSRTLLAFVSDLSVRRNRIRWHLKSSPQSSKKQCAWIRPTGSCNFDTFWKTHSCKIFPNWARSRVITYIIK